MDVKAVIISLCDKICFG